MTGPNVAIHHFIDHPMNLVAKRRRSWWTRYYGTLSTALHSTVKAGWRQMFILCIVRLRRCHLMLHVSFRYVHLLRHVLVGILILIRILAFFDIDSEVQGSVCSHDTIRYAIDCEIMLAFR